MLNQEELTPIQLRLELMPPENLELCNDLGRDAAQFEGPAAEVAPEPEPSEVGPELVEAEHTKNVATNAPSPPDNTVLRQWERERIAKVKRGAKAAHTRRNYKQVFDRFTAWCERRGVQSLPALPDMVEAYLTELADAGYSVAYIRGIWAGIRHYHRNGGHHDVASNESIAETLSGIVRNYARPQAQAKGMTAYVVAKIEAHAFDRRVLGGRTRRMESAKAAQQRGVVDIAIIRVMRDAMLRRSEAATLTWGDLQVEPDGSGLIRVVKSKNDQQGRGKKLFLSKGAVEALMVIRPQDHFPGDSIFGLSDSQIARRIRTAAIQAGVGDGYSGHSARVGMAQDLNAGGAELPALMNAGRWKTPTMPARYTEGTAAKRGAVAQYYARLEGAPQEDETD